MMALLAHYVEPLPIIGTAVTIQKTIVSYQNGKTMEALIRSGVVAFRVVGDVLLVKDIWKTAVEFSFTDDAMEILTTSAVGQMDDVVRVGLISELDDYERLVRESIDDVVEGSGKVLNSFDDVAEYIQKNGKLPDNFITKEQAKALGWNPKTGNLAEVAPGKSIGGNIFKNSEGKLPFSAGRTWYEADINYFSGFRGDERILYSNDGLIYKTTNHYETFTQINK